MIKHIFKLIWNKKGANALVLLEILLAFLVLFAVLSFVFYNVDRLANPLGFEIENRKYVLFGDLEEMDSLTRAQSLDLMKRSLEDLDLIEEVAFSNNVRPFGGSNNCHGNEDKGYVVRACYAVVDHNFINTNGMKITAGRGFLEEDVNAAYHPIIPNEHFMNEFFPGQDMIDSIISFQGDKKIIGVIEAFKYNGEFEESDNRALILNTPGNDVRMTTAYLKLDPSADVSYEERISNTIQSVLKTSSFVIQDAPLLSKRSNLETWIPMVALLSICAFLCINIALGLFGVLSYSISKRKGEVGLRRAIGASGGSITKQFTLEIVLLASLAIFVGIVFAIQVPILELIDAPHDIFYRGIVYAALIILAVVTLCALYPSIQAARIHPATALRED